MTCKKCFSLALVLILLMCVFSAMIFTACGNAAQQGSAPSTNQTSTQSTPPASSSTQSTPPPSSSTNQSGSSGSTDSSNDSAPLEALFADLSGWYNAALTSQYTNPSDLNLMLFFSAGFPDQPQTPTDEEWAALSQLPGFYPEMDLIRLPAAQMDAVLTQYFGILLDDMAESAFAGLVYLDSTDCYYFMATGPIRIEGFKATATNVLEDGTIQLQYQSASGISGTAILIQVGDQYLILSNQYTAD